MHPRAMGRGLVFWAGFWTAFGLLDVELDRHGLSASKVWRWLFRTHTPAGKAATVALVGGGAAVLVIHLLSGPTGRPDRRGHGGTERSTGERAG